VESPTPPRPAPPRQPRQHQPRQDSPANTSPANTSPAKTSPAKTALPRQPRAQAARAPARYLPLHAIMKLYAPFALTEDKRSPETNRRKPTTRSPPSVYLPPKSGRESASLSRKGCQSRSTCWSWSTRGPGTSAGFPSAVTGSILGPGVSAGLPSAVTGSTLGPGTSAGFPSAVTGSAAGVRSVRGRGTPPTPSHALTPPRAPAPSAGSRSPTAAGRRAAAAAAAVSEPATITEAVRVGPTLRPPVARCLPPRTPVGIFSGRTRENPGRRAATITAVSQNARQSTTTTLMTARATPEASIQIPPLETHASYLPTQVRAVESASS
jgi:hypothetical protein